MDEAERKQSYLLKAREAEEEAARANDDGARASWLKIAGSYRKLAEET